MRQQKLAAYFVTHEGNRLEILPSTLFVVLMVGGFGAGSAFLIYLSTFFFPSPSGLSGPIFLVAALIFATWAILAWRTRRTPLGIESDGRVSYGEQELCAAGTVHAVRLAEAPGGERNDIDVLLELVDGKLVAIPSRYFGRFSSRKQARSFAAELAGALRVPVTESS